MHFLSHALGLAVSIAGAVVLQASAMQHGLQTQIACAVYAISLVSMFLSSAAYHAVPARKVRMRQIFRALDHCAILVLIAGTYTAFALTALHGVLGHALLVAMWALCGTGIYRIGARRDAERGPVVFALVMGWLALVAAPELAGSLGSRGTLFFLAGGALYTLGVPFYVWRRLPHHHGVWHLFVLAGSLSHFLAIAWFAVPRGG